MADERFEPFPRENHPEKEEQPSEANSTTAKPMMALLDISISIADKRPWGKKHLCVYLNPLGWESSGQVDFGLACL